MRSRFVLCKTCMHQYSTAVCGFFSSQAKTPCTSIQLLYVDVDEVSSEFLSLLACYTVEEYFVFGVGPSVYATFQMSSSLSNVRYSEADDGVSTRSSIQVLTRNITGHSVYFPGNRLVKIMCPLEDVSSRRSGQTFHTVGMIRQRDPGWHGGWHDVRSCRHPRGSVRRPHLRQLFVQ